MPGQGVEGARPERDRRSAGDLPPVHVLGAGARLGRYAIEAPLGVGGMSVVYAAVDIQLHRRVALKLLRTDRRTSDSASDSSQDYLLSEARALARLSHPNVVTLFDIGSHGDQRYLAIELVCGGSLRQWLRQAPRRAEDILDRMLEAGRGLAAAHAASIVHRDIKPENILIGSDGRARVSDFGLARIDTASGAAQVIRQRATQRSSGGTPVYMAPEQLTRDLSDVRSDQWSFCVTLYEAFAGVRPFAFDSRAARKAAVLEGRLAPPAPGRHVPDWLRRIVTRGLRLDPAARWPSLDALVLALELGRRRHGLATAISGWLPAGGDDCGTEPGTPRSRQRVRAGAG